MPQLIPGAVKYINKYIQKIIASPLWGCFQINRGKMGTVLASSSLVLVAVGKTEAVGEMLSFFSSPGLS